MAIDENDFAIAVGIGDHIQDSAPEQDNSRRTKTNVEPNDGAPSKTAHSSSMDPLQTPLRHPWLANANNNPADAKTAKVRYIELAPERHQWINNISDPTHVAVTAYPTEYTVIQRIAREGTWESTFERPFRPDGTYLESVGLTMSTSLIAWVLINAKWVTFKLRGVICVITFEAVNEAYAWPVPEGYRWVTFFRGDQSLRSP